MTEQQSPQPQSERFPTEQSVEDYVEQVRLCYRRDEGNYSGQRTEYQRLIAEVTADEARLMVDSAMAGILAMNVYGLQAEDNELPYEYETEVQKAGFAWKDFRGEFERLLSGFGVITERLERTGYIDDSYAELEDEDRLKVGGLLLRDFIDHNALRFGARGVGLRGSERKYMLNPETGDYEDVLVVFDKHKARSDKELARNMAERGYTTGDATHQAGKMSPRRYEEIIKEFSEIEKDKLDKEVGSREDALAYFRGEDEKSDGYNR